MIEEKHDYFYVYVDGFFVGRYRKRRAAVEREIQVLFSRQPQRAPVRRKFAQLLYDKKKSGRLFA